ncbi:hypothetical protein AAFF_G00141670 [Aldrovandia affinis]|uniref:Uncharacterized protein n=1 Tax=Aldrovandia affinis TaxID=143900 RepID=A0AAD7TDX0_9TELE|nr:hypothetical protein AAFF_G00141670 [Aldrovandia affinis]
MHQRYHPKADCAFQTWIVYLSERTKVKEKVMSLGFKGRSEVTTSDARGQEQDKSSGRDDLDRIAAILVRLQCASAHPHSYPSLRWAAVAMRPIN